MILSLPINIILMSMPMTIALIMFMVTLDINLTHIIVILFSLQVVLFHKKGSNVCLDCPLIILSQITMLRSPIIPAVQSLLMSAFSMLMMSKTIRY